MRGTEIEVTSQAAPPLHAPLAAARRLHVLAYCGALLILFNLAAPFASLIGIPVSFFLKNRLHLSAHELATFNLWVGLPLYVSFLFGFVRDRWSPFGAGDRGHLIVFGLISAAIYAVCAFIVPTYAMMLFGILIVTIAVQFVSGAAAALTSSAGQQHLMTGQTSVVVNISITLPALAAFFGGLLSDIMEGEVAALAARTLFLVAAALMLAVVLLGVLGPRWLFAEARPSGPRASALNDVRRLARTWAIYPPLIMLALWDFGPAVGTALQYHMANDLHASDGQVGAFYALFYGAMIPMLGVYGLLCQRVPLSRLLVVGTILAVFQMVPLLFVQSTSGALVAAAAMGLMGGMASGAYVDLAIRACPERLQGTMMMLVVTVYWLAVRFGDLWGTELYERGGGFRTAIWATTVVYALILPVIFLTPRRLTATADGQTA
jgi:predicted MFS family arabinose efflux permease